MLAFISMLVAFMQSDKDAPGDHIGDVENITACIKAVLELVGQAPCLLSFSFFLAGGNTSPIGDGNTVFSWFTMWDSVSSYVA